jgi:glycosyltransferase involved in cell wall biosynthesis
LKILLDLQGAQTESRHRGIGRYLREFTRALLPLCDQYGHSVQILLNDRFADAARDIRKDLHNLVSQSSFRMFSPLGATPDCGLSDKELKGFNRRLLKAVIADCRPDVLLIGSLFEDQGNEAITAIEPINIIPTAAIAYDLIPFLHPDTYLSWGPTRSWYLKKIEELKRADLLLSISKSTKQELEQHLAIEAARVVSISTGGSTGFSPEGVSEQEQEILTGRFGLRGSFIYGNGMVEPRKNLEGLIRAYALLPRALKATHRLLISTSAPHGLDRLRKLARSLGIRKEHLIIAGYLSDSELSLLYRACTVFVFPSWHEGFGLPVMEAMQSGAAVLTSNVSSLPEVIGRADALFDPFNPTAIANQLARVLSDEPFRLELKAYGPEQAKQFRWEATAATALTALEQLISSSAKPSSPAALVPAEKPRLAYVAPLNIEDLPYLSHHGAVITELQKVFNVTVISGDNESILRDGRRGFHRVLIALANHSAYGFGLNLLEELPAVVELLDVKLEKLYQSKGLDRWLGELYQCNGYQALLAVTRSQSLHDLHSLSTNESLERNSLGVIGCEEPVSSLAERLESLYQSADLQLALLNHPTNRALAAQSPYAAEVISNTLALNQPLHRRKRQLLLDVTIFAINDAGTGIQRVCKGLLGPLLKEPPSGWSIEPVYLDQYGDYRYARRFCCKFLGIADGWLEDEPVDAVAGDVFLGLDLNLALPQWGRKALSRWAARGILVHFIVYDLLAIRLPECSEKVTREAFPAWLAEIVSFNSLICISKAVADDLKLWLADHPELVNPQRTIRWFHLGAELDGANPSRGLPADSQQLLAKLRSCPTILCVATLEPRKGQAQLLGAADQLWNQGKRFNLVLVGRIGWNVQPLIEAIREHPKLGEQLFWLEGISDEYLELVYGATSCCVNPSHGEGFGLPVVEAARHGMPLLLRDLPVFKEVAGESARYFSGEDPEDLARVLDSWLLENEQSPIPPPTGLTTLTWEQSAEWLIRILEEVSPLPSIQ